MLHSAFMTYCCRGTCRVLQVAEERLADLVPTGYDRDQFSVHLRNAGLPLRVLCQAEAIALVELVRAASLRGHYKRRSPSFTERVRARIGSMGLSRLNSGAAWPRYRLTTAIVYTAIWSMALDVAYRPYEVLETDCGSGQSAPSYGLGDQPRPRRSSVVFPTPVPVRRGWRPSWPYGFLTAKMPESIPVTFGDFTKPFSTGASCGVRTQRITAAAGQRGSISFAFSVGAIPLVHHRSPSHHCGADGVDRRFAFAPCAAPPRRGRPTGKPGIHGTFHQRRRVGPMGARFAAR